MSKRCFNCGVSLKTLPKDQRTNDHIPPQCLFVGFPENFKVNRKTVKCCFTCNNGFSIVDAEFRNIIGFGYDLNFGNMEITKNSIQQLLKAGRIIRKSDGNISITSSKNDVHRFLLRCFKAIYTKTYGEIFVENDFDIIIVDETSIQAEIDQGLLLQQFVLEGENWDKSGSTEVFKYVVKKIGFDANDEMIKVKDINDVVLIGAVMVFVESYMAVVIAKKK